MPADRLRSEARSMQMTVSKRRQTLGFFVFERRRRHLNGLRVNEGQPQIGWGGSEETENEANGCRNGARFFLSFEPIEYWPCAVPAFADRYTNPPRSNRVASLLPPKMQL